MSHYTVLVHLTQSQLEDADGNLKAALAAKLAPFKESPEEGSPFLVFDDKTEEYQEEYEHGESSKQGKHKDHYKSFDRFCREWYGAKKNKEGRYGHNHNPNAKWDWYAVGGRWRGHFPVKPGTTLHVGEPGVFDNAAKPGCSDVVHAANIDFEKAATGEREAFQKFAKEYRDYVAGVRPQTSWDGPRDTMLHLGLLKCVDLPYTQAANETVHPWDREPGFRADPTRADVVIDVSDEELAKCSPYFSPLTTYAVLDGAGQWHAPGEMGWWGVDNSTGDSNLEFSTGFVDKFIRSAGPDDLLVMVDCHI